MAAAAAPRAFSWLKGRVEIYPLLATIGLGVALTGYSCGRHLITNPDVQCSKGLRVSGPVDDNGVVADRAKGYANSLFKQTGEGKKKTIF